MVYLMKTTNKEALAKINARIATTLAFRRIAHTVGPFADMVMTDSTGYDFRDGKTGKQLAHLTVGISTDDDKIHAVVFNTCLGSAQDFAFRIPTNFGAVGTAVASFVTEVINASEDASIAPGSFLG